MSYVVLKNEVTFVILAFFRNDVVAMMPCAGHNVIRYHHLAVSFRECHATNPTGILQHFWFFSHVLDDTKDPVSLNLNIRWVFDPNAVFSEISNNVVFQCNIIGFGDYYTRWLSLVNYWVRNHTASYAHDGILKLDGWFPGEFLSALVDRDVVHLQNTGAKSHSIVVFEEVRNKDATLPWFSQCVTDIFLTSGDLDVSV